MKQTVCLLFFLIMILTAPVSAQETEYSARINISSEVITSIELITVNTMSFSNANPGQQLLRVNPVTDVNAGFMIAVGTAGSEFRLEYMSDRRLERVDGPGFLVFRYNISGNDIEEQATSELVINNEQSFFFNPQGRFYFWVGGQVNLQNALPGNYEGDFTIEIDYI